MESEREPFISTGWLEKRLPLGLWAKRYCRIVENQFIIAKDKNCSKIDILLNINNETIIEVLGDNKFRVFVSNDENVTVRAESNQQMIEWVLSLRSCGFSNSDLTLSDFDIISVLGHGYYGKVILAKAKKNGKLYAIKSIHKAKLFEKKKLHSIMREREIVARISSPFIVQLSFAFQSYSKFYLGLEYASGGELFYHLKANGPMQLEQIRLYVSEIALAFHHLHSIHILYRDLKPENVLLDSEGHIKLVDLGLCIDISQTGVAHTFCGTIDYIPPEMVKEEDYGEPADWWELGILTYELSNGKTPFFSLNRDIQYENILTKTPKFSNDFNPLLKDLILQLLQKDPKQRMDFKSLKEHPLFHGVDFNDILAKKIKPLFVPIQNDGKPLNVNKELLSESKRDSYVIPDDSLMIDIADFSYTAKEFEKSVIPEIV